MWSKQCRETFVPDEIGVLLGWTKMAAVARYETACRAAALPVVAEAWRAGRVDARKVAVIGEQVSYLDPGTAQQVAAEAVDYATETGRCRTGPQLRQWLRRRVIDANPGRRGGTPATSKRGPPGASSPPVRTAWPSCGRCCRGCRAGKSNKPSPRWHRDSVPAILTMPGPWTNAGPTPSSTCSSAELTHPRSTCR